MLKALGNACPHGRPARRGEGGSPLRFFLQQKSTWPFSGPTVGRVKDDKSQLGITSICFFGTIVYGETEFIALLMF